MLFIGLLLLAASFIAACGNAEVQSGRVMAMWRTSQVIGDEEVNPQFYLLIYELATMARRSVRVSKEVYEACNIDDDWQRDRGCQSQG